MSLDILSCTSELGPWPKPEPRKTGEPQQAVRVYTVLIPVYTHGGTHFRRITLPLLSIQGRRP